MSEMMSISMDIEWVVIALFKCLNRSCRDPFSIILGYIIWSIRKNFLMVKSNLTVTNSDLSAQQSLGLDSQNNASQFCVSVNKCNFLANSWLKYENQILHNLCCDALP